MATIPGRDRDSSPPRNRTLAKTGASYRQSGANILAAPVGGKNPSGAGDKLQTPEVSDLRRSISADFNSSFSESGVGTSAGAESASDNLFAHALKRQADMLGNVVNRALSASQLEKWLLYGPKAMPNTVFMTRVTGDIDRKAFSKAINGLVKRHPPLRTIFTVSEKGAPRQNVLHELDVTVDYVDAAAWTEQDTHTRCATDAKKPFDLATGPFLRVSVFSRTPHQHLLFLSAPEISIDRYSLLLIVEELGDLYQRSSSGDDLPTMQTQFVDYIDWLQSFVESRSGRKIWMYWQQTLGGDLPVLDLKTDFPRSAARETAPVGTHTFSISSDITNKLREMCRAEGSDLYTSLLTVFQILLFRYTNQEDFVVGALMPGRKAAPETEFMSGDFANKVAIRTALPGSGSFKSLLSATRRAVQFARAHQDYPFAVLVEKLDQLAQRPKAATAVAAEARVFQNMFVFMDLQSYRMAKLAPLFGNVNGLNLRIGDLDLETMAVAADSISPYEITLTIARAPDDGLNASIQYRKDLFSAQTASRMAAHYELLLSHVVSAASNTETAVSRIPMLTDEEKDILLNKWVTAPADLWPTVPTQNNLKYVHEWFEEMVVKYPRRTALTFTDDEKVTKELTYPELNAKANQLAHVLRELKIVPDNLVCVCIPRSLEMVIAVLAIVKAGACYVPLDPNYPPDRVQFMLKDSETTCVLTVASVAKEQFPTPTEGVTVLCLDTQWESHVASHPTDNLPVVGPADMTSLSYTIYTSGSTGLPKGVSMIHRVLSNLTAWQHTSLGLPTGARTLQFASLSFDVHFQELFSAFTSGGSVHLLTETRRRDMVALLRFIMEMNIERLFLPFVALQALSETALDLNLFPPSLKEVITAGEQLLSSVAVVNFFTRMGQGCSLYNHYGPSETHVVTALKLAWPPSSWPPLPSVGVPITRCKLYIVDSEFRLVPIGVPGELVIGGPVLARGYHRRPDVTANAFIRNPMSLPGPDGSPPTDTDPDNKIWYRTGDLCRFLANGEVEYLERMNNMVKIRGHRVELGEIEVILGANPSVRKVAVVVRQISSPGDGPQTTAAKAIVAYIVPNRELDPETKAPRVPSVDNIRAYVRAKVPDYMVPSFFVFMDDFPLTPSGKIDRKALPAPTSESASSKAKVAPRNEMEKTIATIWAHILHRDEISVVENFFDLGGHSLSATQVLSRIREATGVEIPLVRLFESPTVEGVAQIVEAAGGRANGGELNKSGQVLMSPLIETSFDATTMSGPLGLSYNQQSMYFVSTMSSEAASALHIPYAARVRTQLNVRALRAAFQLLLDRHAALRTAYVATPSGFTQNAVEGVVDFKVIAAQGWSEQVIQKKLAEQAWNEQFRLDAGHLMRVRVFDISQKPNADKNICEESILAITFHHIAVDLWSLSILMAELPRIYDAELAAPSSGPSVLPVVNTSKPYSAYVRWQTTMLASPDGDRLHAYWASQLQDLPVLNLPTDYPRPPQMSHAGSSLPFRISAELSGKLNTLARLEGCTLYTLILTAFVSLLNRYSNQKDIVVGTPMACRTRKEVEQTVGYFINMVPIRAVVEDGITFRSLVSNLRRTCMMALANQEYPFPRMVQDFEKKRDTSRTPLFQVAFVLQKNQDADADKAANDAIVALLLGEDGIDVKLGSLNMQSLGIENPTSQFDLTLTMAEVGDFMTASLQFNHSLFERATIQRMAEHLVVLLESIVATPSERVDTLAIMTPVERNIVLKEFNNTGADVSGEPEIKEAIEAFTAANPTHPGVTDETGTLDYKEMNARANQVAHFVHNRGLGKDQIVGVLMRRSNASVVTMLGIFKSGAAYLPLDANYPPERIAYMLNDAKVSLLFTHRELHAVLPPVHGLTVVVLDAPADRGPSIVGDEKALMRVVSPGDLMACPRDVVNFPIDPRSLAYVIYTSGTTGNPKGVAIEHHSLKNLCVFAKREWKLTKEDHCPVLVGVSFDASVFELWTPMYVGASFYVADDEIRVSPQKLVQYFADAGISFCLIPTPLAEAAMRQKWPKRGVRMRVMCTGGDKLTMRLGKEHAFELVNLYGPTEGTVMSTFGHVDTLEEYQAKSTRKTLVNPHIGKPMLNVQTYILDRRLNPVPIGVPGDLFVAGKGLAREYLNLPDKTAAAFVPHPFEEGAVMYKTGDVARFSVEGNIEFMGRSDFQIKIRGYRIELAEIESVLVAMEEIKEAAVIVVEPQPGLKQLAAYLVSDDPRPTLRAIRAHLNAHVPDYMVPSHFMFLDALPQTANGKVNRAALPKIDEGTGEANYVAPRTQTETMLADIWHEVLKVDRISVTANFFDLGGHSLAAAQVTSRVRDFFRVDVPVVRMFDTPTIDALADYVDALVHSQTTATETLPASSGSQADLAGLTGASTPKTPAAPASDLQLRRATSADLTSLKAALESPDVQGRNDSYPDDQDEYVLSYGQSALWYHYQLSPNTAAFNVTFPTLITTPLDVNAMRRAGESLITRHPILRSIYRDSAGMPVMVYDNFLGLDFQERYDISMTDEQVLEAIRAESLVPFKLDKGPIFRMRVISRAKDAVLVLMTHHIVCDLWSLVVMLEELSELYDIHVKEANKSRARGGLGAPPTGMDMHEGLLEFESNRAATTPMSLKADGTGDSVRTRGGEATYEFHDYARWQRAYMDGPAGDRLWEYWRTQLSGQLPVLNLPTDRPRPALQTYNGATTPVVINAAIMERVRTLLRRQGSTLYMFLMAAWFALLRRYTLQDDLLCGTMMACRRFLEVERMIGFFANPVVMRGKVDENTSFSNLLDQIKHQTLSAMSNQEFPFPLLLKKLQPSRDQSRAPIFQVMFVFERTHGQFASSLEPFVMGEAGATMDFGETLQLRSVDFAERTTPYDVQLVLSEGDTSVTGFLQYNTDLFDRSTMVRMSSHLVTLIESAVDDPSLNTDDLCMLTPLERNQVLFGWNNTTTDISAVADKRVHELFEDMVEKFPNKIALECSNTGVKWTYAELNANANRVAHYLRAYGCVPGCTVGICIPRSANYVMAILSVWKAGGAYVPIDPSFPVTRVMAMLTDSQAKIVLTMSTMLPLVNEHKSHFLCLDSDWSTIARASAENMEQIETRDPVANVIYTSGTTGTPKGILVPHRALVNVLMWYKRLFKITSDYRAGQMLGPAFDPVFLELWPVLTTGGTLCVMDEASRTDPKLLIEWWTKHKINLQMMATPMTELVLHEPWPRDFPMRVMCTGGDKLVSGMRPGFPDMHLVNVYGPSETTVGCTAGIVAINAVNPHIGIATDNTQVYILDKRMRPVPAGVPGQICVGGAQVTLGYLGRPELTNSVFVPDTFGPQRADWKAPKYGEPKLYLTGDMARWRADGTIEYMGRVDTQVKIRGFRIELAEIEVVLGKHPAVTASCVVVDSKTAGEKRLVAYVVLDLKNHPKATIHEVLGYLKVQLPDYMVPRAIVRLDRLPETPNGKVDKRALPAPEYSDGGHDGLDQTPPRNTLESALAGVWADVLGVSRVGIHSNFFDLGGHSLLAARLVSKITDTLNVELTMSHIFQNPTVASLAAVLEAKSRGVDNSWSVPPLVDDTDLDSAIAPRVQYDRNTDLRSPEAIFLTGVTGFVGAFLLRTLLEKTTAQIYCLVRCASAADGFSRIIDNMKNYGLTGNAANQSFEQRVVVVRGNLSQAQLGLPDADFSKLAESIDIIIHNGAMVNFVYPYAASKEANVGGTQEVLRLAVTGDRVRPVHFVSTLSTIDTDSKSISEKDVFKSYERLVSGYAQSKWVAEQLVIAARPRGIPTCLHRLGRITGHSETGRGNPDDLLLRLIKGCIQLRMAPKLQTLVDMTPVDYCCKVIVELALEPRALGKNFHIMNRNPILLSKIFDFCRKFGFPLEIVEYNVWFEALMEHSKRSQENVLYPVLSLFAANKKGHGPTLEDELPPPDKYPTFSFPNSDACLGATLSQSPAIDEALLRTYFTAMVEEGFLEAPPAANPPA